MLTDHSSFYANVASGFNANTADCIHIKDFAATAQISNVECNQTHIGINIDCPTSSSIAACPQFVTIFDFETEANGAVHASGDSNAIGIVASDTEHFNCYGCQIYGYITNNNVKLYSSRFAGNYDYQFHGGKFTSAQQDCFLMSVSGVTIDGAQISGCNTGGTGGYGINFRPSIFGAADSGSLTVHHVNFCWDAGGTPTSMAAMYWAVGTDYDASDHNNYRGCTSDLTNSSGGSHNQIDTGRPH